MMNDTRIEADALLTKVQRRRVRAALALLALRQKDFAESVDLDMYRVSRMLSRREAVTVEYAEAFNGLLDRAQEVLQGEDRAPQPAASAA